MWDLTFYLANTPPLPGPRLDVDIGILQKLLRHRSVFASLVLQKLDGQDRLTEVGHSVDGSVFQALRGFVLSIALTPLVDMLAIVGEFLNWSVDAGFILALPFHHSDLDLHSVGLSTKDHVAILVAWPWLGEGGEGGNLRDKKTCARTLTENVGGGGGLYAKGDIYAGRYGIIALHSSILHVCMVYYSGVHKLH